MSKNISAGGKKVQTSDGNCFDDCRGKMLSIPLSLQTTHKHAKIKKLVCSQVSLAI